MDIDSDSDLESPIIASATVATLKPASPSNKTTQNGTTVAKENIAIFERAKKRAEEEKMREERLVMEEKIPVFDDDMLLAAGQNKAGGPNEEKVMMSATSYPGQEWNPYGDGGYESD
ncbi:hypothetical protein QBC44DRAFT_318592 [Cladorrhinum sp. PSN332]|nr:hypothetical protein QBC44DRAFT_318592 [Cladorrhinum sp. PSN332]